MKLKSFFKKLFKKHAKTFSRSTATSFAASLVDFGCLYVLVEYFHVYYVTATAIASLVGAIVNFTLNKIWAFEALNSKPKQILSEAIKYALVSGTSLGLNTLLVFLFTEWLGLRYLHSKLIGSLIVGWAWNYPLQKYVVFKR